MGVLDRLLGKKEKVPHRSEFRLTTSKGVCRIEKGPDGLCDFFDENGQKWCLFGFADKKFDIEAMVRQIVLSKLKNELFLFRSSRLLEGDFELTDLPAAEKKRRIVRAFNRGEVDLVPFAKMIRYVPFEDEEILSMRGRTPVLVRKSDNHLVQGNALTDVKREN